jgi:hypothetical protein
MAKPRSQGPSGPTEAPPGRQTGDAAAEIAKLRHSIDALEQGLTQLLEATSTHTEMLRALLAAATAPTDPEQNLEFLLKAVVGRLAEQSAVLRSVGQTMTRLPDDVGAAVGAQMASALAAVQ